MKGVKVLVFELEPLGVSSRGWRIMDRLEVPTLNQGVMLREASGYLLLCERMLQLKAPPKSGRSLQMR